MLTYLGLGVSMGLSAGISPGPLLTLVITASLRNGLPGGLWVALSPLITDAPIIALSVLLAGSLPPEALRWVGTVGGLVVIWLGIDTVRSSARVVLPQDAEAVADPRRELWRGVVVNALNPHPYLYWATVGGPALVSGWRLSPWHALAYMIPFYALLIGSKMAVAWLVSSRAGALSLTWYRRVMAGTGVLLLGMGLVLIWEMWRGG